MRPLFVRPRHLRQIGRSANQSVPDSLLIALFVIVLDRLTNDAPKMGFAERNDLNQTLRLDRAHESFGVRIEIRSSAREPQRTDVGTHKGRSKCLREDGISVVNQILALAEESTVATIAPQ